jgi:hypothetical protein
MTDTYVLSCYKDDVYLSRCKKNHMYLIEFKAVNNKINIRGILNFDLYKMMFELNKDVFESYKIIFPDSDNTSVAEILFIFKTLPGLGERYTHVVACMPHLLESENKNLIKIESSNANKETSFLKQFIPKNATQIDSDNSSILINVSSDNHSIQFYYNFKMLLSSDDKIYIPPMVDTIVSKYMKTIFVRIKLFIESLG